VKKIALIIALLGLSAAAGGTVFGIVKAKSNDTAFEQNGNVLLGENAGEEKTVPVSEGGIYSVSKGGAVRFNDANGKARLETDQSFVRYEDDSVMSFTNGVLLDLNDLSDNFINNYAVPAEMTISRNGSDYIAYTTNGNITFGDHIWKLSDDKYLIQSPTLKVHFADDDEREVKDFVQVFKSEEGIVYMLTGENIWTTISQNCYIQTESGKRIMPLVSRVEDDNYKISLAGLSVGADDNIVLTSDQVRRQIVPEIKVTTIDGTDGDDGADGIDGENGENGEAGNDGKAGTSGTDGTDGENGAEGTSGSGGSSGSSGTDGKDGKMGDKGEEGETGAYIEGRSGSGGSTGSSGSDGTGGDGGDKGNDGNDGESGGKGSAGAQGNNGTGGTRGGDGDDGEDGTKGTAGAAGKKGVDADSLSSQNSQIPIMTIGEWNVSSTGLKGGIVISDVSGLLHNLFKDESETGGIDATALPNIYPGEVKVTDTLTGEEIICFPYKEGKQYTEFDDSSNFYKYFNGPDLAGEDKKTYTAYFGIKSGTTLKPDTQYTLEVSAYYAAAKYTDKEGGYAYKRTFITRNFYTDSSGVILSRNKAEESRLLVDTSLDSSLNRSNLCVQVYLLTPAQNELFSLTTSTNPQNYVYCYTLQYNHEGTGFSLTGVPGEGDDARGAGVNPGSEPVPYAPTYTLEYVPEKFNIQTELWEQLPSDTTYIARVVAKPYDGGKQIEYLSSQKLELKTLKKTPTAYVWVPKQGDGGLEKQEMAIKEAAPTVTYNRVTGGFSVTRPIINDPDQAVVSYKYIPYVAVTNSEGQFLYWEVVEGMEKTIGLNESEPVEFYLPTGSDKKYCFSVEVETFDNEKTVYYESAKSEEQQAFGSTLPKISFTGTSTYDSVSGQVTFSLGAGTNVEISETKPMLIDIFADGYYMNTVAYKGNAVCGERSGFSGTCSESCSCHGASGEGCLPGCAVCSCDWWMGQKIDAANGFSFTFDLAHLYRNQKYTVTLRGSAKLTDGTGEDAYAMTELGTFTFRTNNVSQLTGNWGKLDGYDDPLATTLYLTSSDDTGYEIAQIQKGRVIIQLYEGQGTTGRVLGTREITTAAELRQITYDDREDKEHKEKKDPFIITKDTFGKDVTLTTGENYTIKVSSVMDITYDLETTKKAYINYFINIVEQTKIIASQATPPDLFKEPTQGINAEPILNKEAATYGGEVDPDLSDDAIVGYRLESKYDNVAGLARQVRYYAFEYNDFYNALVNKVDPVGYYLTNDGKDMYEDPELDDPGIHKLLIMTREMTGEEAEPPKVAVLFDCAATDTDSDARQFGGYMVYRVKSFTESGGEKNGMSRGLRYVFAYTVEYTLGTQSGMKIYPYSHTKYADYMRDYGIGLVGSRQRFTGEDAVAYILNSGKLDTPKDEPEFHTYLYNAKPTVKYLGGSTQPISSGLATMYYTYVDPDETITVSNGNIALHYSGLVQDGNGIINNPNITVTSRAIQTENEWESVDMTFITQMRSILKTQDIHSILPKVDRTLYRLDYSAMLAAFGLKPDVDQAPMGSVSADFDWDGFFAEENLSRTNDIPQMSVSNHASDYNYIDFKFVLDDSSDTLTPLLAERAYAVKVYAEGKDKNGDTVKAEKLLKVEGDGSTSAYARLSVGDLAGFAAGKVKFSVDVIYDDGDAGWAYTALNELSGEGLPIDSQQVGFGLYFTQKGTEILSKYGYLYQGTNVFTLPYGGLFEKKTAVPDFQKMVEDNEREQANFKYQITGTRYERWIYPFEAGVDTNGLDRTVGTPDNYILTPKGACSTKGYFGASTETESTVDIILPVISYQNYEALKQSIFLRAKGIDGKLLEMSGLDTAEAHDWSEFDWSSPELEGQTPQTGKFYIVHIGVFEQTGEEEKYAKLDSSVQLPVSPEQAAVTHWQQNSLSHLVFNADGSLYGYCETSADGQTVVSTSLVHTYYDNNKETEGWKNLPPIKNLNPEVLATKNYYISFFMDFNSAKEGDPKMIGQRIILATDKLSGTDPKAWYPVTTSDGVQVLIANNTVNYNKNNESYFSKKADFSFDLVPRSYGVKMRYEIYETRAEAEKGMYAETKPASPYLDLNSPSTPSKLLTTAVVLTNTKNKVELNLTPSDIQYLNMQPGMEAMSNLLPGHTYYLRATAFDATASSYTEKTAQGHGVAAINVAANTFLANINMKARTAESIDFRISIGDSEHMAMGFRYQESIPGATIDPDPTDKENRKYNDEGFYAVRFTDAATGKLIKTDYDDYVYSFADLEQVFKLTDLPATEEGHEYSCNVYAVMDYDLDGVSGPVDGLAGSGQTWDYFFADVWKTGKDFKDVRAYIADKFNDVIDRLWLADGSENKSAAAENIRANYLVGSETKKTTPKEGMINIPEGKSRIYAETNGFTLELTESFGVVTKNKQDELVQGFDKIVWSIKEKAVKPRAYTGQASKTNGDPMFEAELDQSGELTGTFTYYMDMGEDHAVQSGVEYEISIQLIKTGDPANSYSFSEVIIK